MAATLVHPGMPSMALGHEGPTSFGPQQRQFNPYSGPPSLSRTLAFLFLWSPG